MTLSLISYEFDDSGFAELVDRLESGLPSELAAVAFDLGDEGKRLVQEAMIALIYSQPERGYTRTEELFRSAYGYHELTAEGFDLVVGAVGGAEGRRYADYVNRGTYSSRIDRDTILADARAAADFAPRSYPRGESGMEARPFAEFSIAQLERELEPRVQLALVRALS